MRCSLTFFRLGFSVLALSILMLSSAPAWAKPKPGKHSAPEMDPAGVSAVVTLLVGGLAVARGRRRSG